MLSPVRIMQYFKNSICMKRPTPAAYYQYPPLIEPPTKRATYGEVKCEKIEAEPHWSILQIFLPTSANMHTQLANNRISNVWRIISPKKSRQFSFQLIPTRSLPQPWSNHRGLNVVTIYFQFFFLGWQTPLPAWTPLTSHFQCKYSNYSVEQTPSTKKTALWESLTRGENSQNKWNNYTVRYWIELNMHTYYYLLLLLLLYTIFLFILSDDPKSTVLDGKPR